YLSAGLALPMSTFGSDALPLTPPDAASAIRTSFLYNGVEVMGEIPFFAGVITSLTSGTQTAISPGGSDCYLRDGARSRSTAAAAHRACCARQGWMFVTR